VARALVRLLLITLPLACGEGAPPSDPEVRVTVGAVALDESNTPVVLLQEDGGPRMLPIWIGTAEAGSIAAQIEHLVPPRPNFHDLAQRVIQALDARVDRVVVTELRGGTYFALLHLRRDGDTLAIDVRPSDGIAVALRMKAPILVRSSVFDAAGEALDGDEADERRIDTPAPVGNSPATGGVSL
jgi:bifunctional DNase/RNase